MSEEKRDRFDHVFEICVACLLGITALLTAYASWQSSLYGGNQSTNYTEGSAAVAEGNSMYNESAQLLSEDMGIFNSINSLRIDLTFAEQNNDEAEAARVQWKLDELLQNSASDELVEAIAWSDEQTEATGEFVSPFAKEGFTESYFTEAQAKYEEGYAQIEQGKNDNARGDVLGLTTVIYAVVLFLLGIITSFKNQKVKLAVGILSVAALIFAVIFMLRVPYIPLTWPSL
ncbi:MAG: hypothetical protein PHD32_06720 [Eubacteriales bacterium]|nr:hypothetical protein [Eubacteriales bacterium]